MFDKVNAILGIESESNLHCNQDHCVVGRIGGREEGEGEADPGGARQDAGEYTVTAEE